MHSSCLVSIPLGLFQKWQIDLWALSFVFIIYFQGDAATVEFQYIATLFLYDALEVESFFNSVIFIFKLG